MTKISVTEDDIKRGHRCSAGCCPVALAICRMFPTSSVSVGKRTFGVYGGPNGHLPQIAMDFIHNFDNENYVSPFEFEI